jgi:protein-S-isoprenylcysteine O-methyltransferase Ste14
MALRHGVRHQAVGDSGRPSVQRPIRAMRCPRSATNFGLCCIALAVGLALVWMIAPGHIAGAASIIPYAPLIPCLGIVAVIAGTEWLFPGLRSDSDPYAARALRPFDMGRIGVRLLGLGATLALVGFAYWLLPEYHGDFYEPYWQFLRSIAPAMVLAPVYFLWADSRSRETRDEYLAFGSLLCNRLQSEDWSLIKRHLLGWTVKAFFLPLMTVYLSQELRALHGALGSVSLHTMPLYQVFYHLSYATDLLFCVVGYSATLRLFDSQIRSVEPSVAGWLVALICYQPFYSVVGRFYLQYDDATYWDNWLELWPATRAVWGVLIILLASIYAICTVAFGLRFSNLTHRGIITSGPYRFSKHPAYLAKNLSWWLISVPFVSELGWSAALRNCCLLILVNLIYYARARTEERHLSRDPTYVAYALWMNEHGLLRGLATVLPFMRYQGRIGAEADSSAPAQ